MGKGSREGARLPALAEPLGDDRLKAGDLLQVHGNLFNANRAALHESQACLPRTRIAILLLAGLEEGHILVVVFCKQRKQSDWDFALSEGC